MYIIYKEDLSFIGIFKEKTALANVVGVSTATILRHLKDKRWEKNGFIILFPTFVQEKSCRGGRNNPKFR